jgi:DNA-binding transcriptional ArsR family regulator
VFFPQHARLPVVTSKEGRGNIMNMPEHEINLQALAFLAKCLADENRLRILRCVGKGKKPVSRIVEELGLSQPLVSHHLKELRRSLLVTVERSGPFVYYELADARILGILESLDALGRDLLSDRTTF